MRSIHPGIWPKPRSNVAEDQVQPAVEPVLSLVLPKQPAKVARPRAKHNGLIFALILGVSVFAVVFSTYVLSPAVATLVGAEGEDWNP